ncbi:replicative DNA helicase [Paenibacillus alvei]|uniref:replicative DNA helicase n=1 Tax=Paenibacillus alvei TaxID=44250 RepID=UPI0022829005|nr:replicative DNA helicase [Paenibacillus alvei]MCY9737539.1 replicative DNA helicase [Paenibacillus alvei]
MAKLKAESDVLCQEAIISEGCLVGLFWNNPNLYSYYSEERLSSRMFGNKDWGFYFGLGRKMHEGKTLLFDDITTEQYVTSLGCRRYYEKFGEYDKIFEVMEEVKDYEENIESYYNEVKKYSLLRELRNLFDDKVVKENGNYNYRVMTREAIYRYWMDKLNQVALDNESQIEEFDLLDGLEELIEELDNDPDIGMPFYNAEKFTDIVNGWAHGTITLLSGFSGNGKTSFAIEKLIMSCIKENEKLLIMANEMGLKDFQKTLLVSIMGSKELQEKAGLEDLFKKGFNRKQINKGNFSDEEKDKLKAAVAWIRHYCKDTGLIKFVALEEYTIDNVEKVMRRYANRGYSRMILDTAKPTEGGASSQRWQQFVEDFERMYKVVRPEGGGLNIALFCTIQAADEALKWRYLDERCIAEAKKIKNVVDTSFHLRPVWGDEYDGEDKALEVFKFVPNRLKTTDKPYVKEKVKLQKDHIYYLLFTSKNRRGQSNLTGLDVLVFSVNFNNNRWTEVGWTTVHKDSSMM